MAGDRERNARGGPAVDDLDVPVLGEPVGEGVGDDPADSVDGRELVACRRADRIERTEVGGKRPRRHRADVADAQGDQEPPEVLRLRALELGDELERGGRRGDDPHPGDSGSSAFGRGETLGLAGILRRDLPEGSAHPLRPVVLLLREPGLAVAHHDLDRQEVVDGELEEAGLRHERRILRGARLGEGRGGDLAQHLDVEGTTAADVLDAPAHLGGTAARVRAAEVDVAVLHGPQRRSACGAVRRHHELAFGAVPQFDNRAEHLGDDVPGLAQHDGVSDEYALGLDDLLVVQGRLAHLAAGDERLLHHGERRRPPGAADRHHDVEELGVDLLRRVLEGGCPARGAAGRAELEVQVEVVHLDDDAVDLVLDSPAGGPVAADVPCHVGDVVEDLEVGRDGEAPCGEQPVDLGLGGEGSLALDLPDGPGPDAVHEHPQSGEPIFHEGEPLGRLVLLLLAQGSARRVAGVREHPLARGGLPGIELVERGDGEEDLAAHLDELGVPRAAQSVGDGAHREDVLGDVLADDAVAAGRRRDEDAALVAQVDREPVDLQLCEVAHGRGTGVPLDLGGPGVELLLAEDVVEAEHPLGMHDGGEEGGLGAASDGLGGAVLGLEPREGRLQLGEAQHERVVLLVGDGRGVLRIVGVAQQEEAGGQVIRFALRVIERLGRLGLGHGLSLGTAGDTQPCRRVVTRAPGRRTAARVRRR